MDEGSAPGNEHHSWGSEKRPRTLRDTSCSSSWNLICTYQGEAGSWVSDAPRPPNSASRHSVLMVRLWLGESSLRRVFGGSEPSSALTLGVSNRPASCEASKPICCGSHACRHDSRKFSLMAVSEPPRARGAETNGNASVVRTAEILHSLRFCLHQIIINRSSWSRKQVLPQRKEQNSAPNYCWIKNV